VLTRERVNGCCWVAVEERRGLGTSGAVAWGRKREGERRSTHMGRSERRLWWG